MRSATIFERVHSGLASAPRYVFTVGVLVVGLVITGLWWLWPTLSVVAMLILLLGFGSHIAWLRRKVRELADRDPLTGVASRACFLDELNRAIARGNRSGTPLSAAVLDCDDFKSVNEQHGHAVGDAVLIEAADVLSQTVGHSGTVGRIWGDAFGILLPGFTLEKARQPAPRGRGTFASADECALLAGDFQHWCFVPGRADRDGKRSACGRGRIDVRGQTPRSQWDRLSWSAGGTECGNR